MTPLPLRATQLKRFALLALFVALFGTWLALAFTARTTTTLLLTPQERAEWEAAGSPIRRPFRAASSFMKRDRTPRDSLGRWPATSMDLDRASVRGPFAFGALAVSGVSFAFALALGFRSRRRREGER